MVSISFTFWHKAWSSNIHTLTVSHFLGKVLYQTKSYICLCFENCFLANAEMVQDGDKLALKLDPGHRASNRHTMTTLHYMRWVLCQTKSDFERYVLVIAKVLTVWSKLALKGLRTWQAVVDSFALFVTIIMPDRTPHMLMFSRNVVCTNTNLSLVRNELVLKLNPRFWIFNDMFKRSLNVSSWTIMLNFLYISWCIWQGIYVSAQ